MRTHLASNDALCLKHCGVLRETCDFGVAVKVLPASSLFLYLRISRKSVNIDSLTISRVFS